MMGETTRKSLLAGVLISVAAMFSMRVAEYGPLTQGLCFSVGLFGILCSDAALFTGRMLSVRYVLNGEMGETPVRKMLREWAFVLVRNFAGVAVVAAIAYVLGYDASEIARVKAEMPVFEMLLKAMLCNVMVCLAVYSGRWAKSVTDRFFACLLPVACFVTCGFEHSIADMFYMLLGLFNGGVDAVGVIYVLTVSVAGNVIGGTAYAVLGYERRN